MEARDSSMMDLMRLKSLREGRVAARATAERERLAARARERAEAQKQRELQAARLSAARESLQQELSERRSRSTLERITDLRGELDAFERERELRRLETEARIDTLVRRSTRRDRRGLYAFVAACAVSIGLFALADLRSDAVASLSPPELQRIAALEHTTTPLDAPASASDESGTATGGLPVEVTAQEPAAPAATTPDLAAPEPERSVSTATAAPARRVTSATRKPVVKKPVAAPRAAHTEDVLGNLDDCGDDPICGL